MIVHVLGGTSGLGGGGSVAKTSSQIKINCRQHGGSEPQTMSPTSCPGPTSKFLRAALTEPLPSWHTRNSIRMQLYFQI
eukprot:4938177-Amphidinium_carterae.1